MTAEELMTIANMGKGTDMSSYEHFMMAEKSARRPSGVGIAGLAIGSTALLAASFTHSLWRIWHYGLSFFLMFLITITPKVMGKYIKPRTIKQAPPKVINCPNCGK